jgi:hypothetical protein
MAFRPGLTILLVGVIVLALGLGGLDGAALAADEAPASEQTTEASPSASEVRLEGLEMQVDDLDRFVNRLLLPLSILVGLLAGGGVIGLITSIRYERRQTELHKLTVAGEAASQERAAESHFKFLNDSHQTLTLVNDTLRLAREASERAEKAVKQKASERLKEIDRDAKEVLGDALDSGDFKVVVSDPWTREQLEDVAERLRGVEGYADAHELGLSPHCLFAKGLDRHLRSAPQRAIESWCEAAEEAKDPELAALARFWVGYERNNIGHFPKAAKAFHLAREAHLPDKERAQHYELSRIEIQTRFFEVAKEQLGSASRRRRAIQGFLGELDELIEALDGSRQDFESERRHCEETAGELLLWVARLSPLERAADEEPGAEERECLHAAIDRFGRAPGHVWAQFGCAQARWALGEELEEDDYHALLDTLMSEAGSHKERRSLALRHAAILIAEGAHHDSLEVVEAAYRDLCNDVLRIGGRLTVFSPWQKRNVNLDEFKKEAQTFRDRYRSS